MTRTISITLFALLMAAPAFAGQVGVIQPPALINPPVAPPVAVAPPLVRPPPSPANLVTPPTAPGPATGLGAAGPRLAGPGGSPAISAGQASGVNLSGLSRAEMTQARGNILQALRRTDLPADLQQVLQQQLTQLNTALGR